MTSSAVIKRSILAIAAALLIGGCQGLKADAPISRLPLDVLLRGNWPAADSIESLLNDDYDNKIIGGQVVQPNSLPFQISLQRCGAMGCSHSCGGSILSADIILDAAHCISTTAISNFLIVAGEHSLSQVSGNEQNRGVRRIVQHENYNSQNSFNDIALFFLDSPLELNDKVAPINLPPAGYDPPVGTVVTVSGWGTTGGNTLSDLLQSVNVNVISDKQCEESYYAGSIYYDGNICASLPFGGADACQGDSGGPLFTGTGDNAVQHGIVSWGYRCAVMGFPGVYTQVSNYVDWIAANSN